MPQSTHAQFFIEKYDWGRDMPRITAIFTQTQHIKKAAAALSRGGRFICFKKVFQEA